MATIYAYIEDGYAVFRDAANKVFNTVPAAELSVTTDAVQNVYFIHRRDAFAVAPFNSLTSVPPQQFAQAAPNEILRKNGTQYTALLTFDDFWAVWQTENPLTPIVAVTSPELDDIKTAVEALNMRLSNTLTVTHTLRTTLATFETPVNAKKVAIIALAGGSFTVGSVTYPVITANGVIDVLEVGNGINPIAQITYTVAAANVLQIVEA